MPDSVGDWGYGDTPNRSALVLMDLWSDERERLKKLNS